jgi:hypothetical protein
MPESYTHGPMSALVCPAAGSSEEIWDAPSSQASILEARTEAVFLVLWLEFFVFLEVGGRKVGG